MRPEGVCTYRVLGLVPSIFDPSVSRQLQKNGLRKNGLLKNGLSLEFRFDPWKSSTFRTTNEDDDTETSSSDTSDDDDYL